MDSNNTSLREPVCIDEEVFFGPIGETEVKVKETLGENLCGNSVACSFKMKFVEERNDISEDECQKHEISSIYNSFSIEDSKYDSFEDSLDSKYQDDYKGFCVSGLVPEYLNDSIRLAHDRQRMKNAVLYDSLEDICSLASNIDRGSISADIENVTNLLEKPFISEDSLRHVPENILNKESNFNEQLHFDDDSLAIFEHEKTFDDSLDEFSDVQKLHILENTTVEKQSVIIEEINKNTPIMTRNLFETSIDIIYEKNENVTAFEKKILPDENSASVKRNSFSNCDCTDNFKDSLEESHHSSLLSGKEKLIDDEYYENKSMPGNTVNMNSLVISQVGRSLLPPIISDSVQIASNTTVCNAYSVDPVIAKNRTIKKEVDSDYCTKNVSQDVCDRKPRVSSNGTLYFDNNCVNSNHELDMRSSLKFAKLECYDGTISNQNLSIEKPSEDIFDIKPCISSNHIAYVGDTNANVNGNSNKMNLSQNISCLKPCVSSNDTIIIDDDDDCFNLSKVNTKRNIRKRSEFFSMSQGICEQEAYINPNDTMCVDDGDFVNPSQLNGNEILNNKTNYDLVTGVENSHCAKVSKDIHSLEPCMSSNDTIYIDDDDYMSTSGNAKMNEIKNDEINNCDQLSNLSKCIVSKPSQEINGHKLCIDSNDTIYIEDEDYLNMSQIIMKDISSDKTSNCTQVASVQDFTLAKEPEYVCDLKPSISSNNTICIDDNKDCIFSSPDFKVCVSSNNTICIDDDDDCIYPSSEFNVNKILNIKEEKDVEGSSSMQTLKASHQPELTKNYAKSPSKSCQNSRFLEEFSNCDLPKNIFENSGQPNISTAPCNNITVNVPETDCRILVNDQCFNYGNEDIETLHKKLTSDLNLKLQVQLKIGNVQCEVAASAIELKPILSAECATNGRSDLNEKAKSENKKASAKHNISGEISRSRKLASRKRSDDSKKCQSNSNIDDAHLLQALDLHDISLSFRESTRVQSKDSIIPLNLCTRENYFKMLNLSNESKENIPAYNTPFNVLREKVIASNKYKNQHTFKENKRSPSKTFQIKTPSNEDKLSKELCSKKSSGTKIPIRKIDNDVTPSQRTPKVGVKNLLSTAKLNTPTAKSAKKCTPSDKIPSELVTCNKTPHYCIPRSNLNSKLPKSAQKLSAKKYQNIESPVAKYIRDARTPKNIRPFTGRPLNFINTPQTFVETAVHESAVSPRGHPEWKRTKK